MEPMRVKLCDGETFVVEWEGLLADFLEENPDEDAEAIRDEMLKTGRHWTGGGAAPLMILQRA